MSNAAVRPELVEGQIQQAAKFLRAGDLVAFPTETVYGLGADARNLAALAKIFAVKGRPADHPLIVHIPDVSHLEQWAGEIPDAARLLAQAFWPGPLTLILKRQPDVPDLVTGGQDTVGLRIPNHPLALQLLKAFNNGIAAPSANRFGRISPTTARHVREELGDAVALVLDGGPCAVGIESTIVDLARGEPVILRPGMIDAQQIEHVLHQRVARHSRESGNPATSTPRVSGSLAAHYAPLTRMRLVPADELANQVQQGLSTGQRIAMLSMQSPATHEHLQWRQAAGEPRRYAHDLYANLRALDAAGADLILIETPPQTPQWLAIHDRLNRASHGSGSN